MPFLFSREISENDDVILDARRGQQHLVGCVVNSLDVPQGDEDGAEKVDDRNEGKLNFGTIGPDRPGVAPFRIEELLFGERHQDADLGAAPSWGPDEGDGQDRLEGVVGSEGSDREGAEDRLFAVDLERDRKFLQERDDLVGTERAERRPALLLGNEFRGDTGGLLKLGGVHECDQLR